MKRIYLSVTPFVAYGALALLAVTAYAQRENNNPPGDIKPVQAKSPAANPAAPNSGRNVIDRPRNADVDEGSSGRRTGRDSAKVENADRRQNRGENLNRQLAACLLWKNKGEVELGNFAAERTKDDSVKEFASQMVNDHSEVAAKLEKIVGSDEPDDKRSQIAHEIDEQCLASLKQELGDKSGKEFDAAYVGSQIGGHMQMAAALKVLSKHATGELKEVITKAQPTVDKHLAHAKKLMEQLDKTENRSQASKPSSESNR